MHPKPLYHLPARVDISTDDLVSRLSYLDHHRQAQNPQSPMSQHSQETGTSD